MAVAFRKIYRLRQPNPGSKAVEVSFPWEVLEREARSRSLSVTEFIQRFVVAAEYGDFEGVRYTFIEEAEANK